MSLFEYLFERNLHHVHPDARWWKSIPAAPAKDQNRRMPDGRYSRIQARYCGRLGVEVGIFVAVDHLRRAGRLSEAQVETYVTIDEWFHEHLPEPPFYEDGNSVGAVTWFKNPVPADMASRIGRLRHILTSHDIAHDVVQSDDPGTIVYDDPFQVGVVPLTRKPQTELPVNLRLGPTTAGSKRGLPHGPIGTPAGASPSTERRS